MLKYKHANHRPIEVSTHLYGSNARTPEAMRDEVQSAADFASTSTFVFVASILYAGTYCFFLRLSCCSRQAWLIDVRRSTRHTTCKLMSRLEKRHATASAVHTTRNYIFAQDRLTAATSCWINLHGHKRRPDVTMSNIPAIERCASNLKHLFLVKTRRELSCKQHVSKLAIGTFIEYSQSDCLNAVAILRTSEYYQGNRHDWWLASQFQLRQVCSQPL